MEIIDHLLESPAENPYYILKAQSIMHTAASEQFNLPN